MKSVTLPPIDAAATYSLISNSRRYLEVRQRLQEAEPVVLGAYRAYTHEAEDVTRLEATDTQPATPGDLIGNFESKSVAAKQLRAEVFANNDGGKCALCGQVSAATLDHYLPRSIFPEFSILPPNLVPACWQCNHRKGHSYRNNSALFIHCYFDSVPRDVQFLFAEVQIDPPNVSFSYWVDPPAELDRLQGRIRSHFEELELADAYGIEAINEYGERREQLRRVYEINGDATDVVQYLTDEARSVAADKGMNHWRYVALQAMADSGDLCDGGFLA